MRNQSSIILTGTADATITGSIALDTNQAINLTFQTIVTGGVAAAGTVKVQGSNDTIQGKRADAVPTNWSDIPGATAVMTAGIAPMIVLSNVACQYMRVVWTRTAGVVDETITVKANSVGA